ncbi:MAG: hypothetical protein QOD51_453 [Candidatus Eremiobacteraeota bacterium]|nr:hypothetical protein [Candidatus Eremiobacteraeota bacterium]
MKLTRIAALLAVPTALSLAACGGGSTGTIANVSGNTSNVRIVNGAPGITGTGAVDIYFQTTGSAAPSQPLINNLGYGVASDFTTQPAAATSVIVQRAGGPAPSTGTGQLSSCPLPQLSSNSKYSIVIVNANGVVNCDIFQDFDYTTAPQYRVHNAARNGALSANAGFGIIPSASAPPGTPFTVQVVGPQGNIAAANSAATAFTAAQPQSIAAFSGSITFAVGAGTSGTTPALATLDSRAIFAPNGTTQPNTTGALNFTGTAGTSLFALDCTGATVIAPNVTCTNGIALVGYTDRL